MEPARNLSEPFGIAGFGELVGEVGVFDDGHFSVDEAEVAELFLGAGFGEHFGGHLCAIEIVQAEEGGIDAADDGVVDLEVGDLCDAAFLHVGDGAGFPEGEEGAAVAVGGEGEGIFGLEEDFAVGGEGGQFILREEHDVGGIHAEVVVLFPEVARRGVVLWGGHDVEGDGACRSVCRWRGGIRRSIGRGFSF